MFLQALAVFAILGCSKLANGQLNFEQCSDYNTGIQTCVNTYPIGETGAAALNIFSQNSTICGIISKYKELAGCIVNVSLKCLTDDYKTLFPSAEKYSSAITHFCDRIGTFDSTCFLGSISEISQCILDNGPAALKGGEGFDEVKTNYCAALDTGIDCYTKNTKLSSCEDTRTTLIEVSKMTTPPACGTMRVVSHILLLILSVVFSKYVCY